MREKTTQNGLTLRAIAGAHSVLLAWDLDEAQIGNCLGFTIRRTNNATGETRSLPNLLSFPSHQGDGPITTERAPLQKFRWGDYTTVPNTSYTYEIQARYGVAGRSPGDADGLDATRGAKSQLSVTTEDLSQPQSAVFFNRGAAASIAFQSKFPDIDAEQIESDDPTGHKARQWLSRGLEEAVIAFLERAEGKGHALLAAIYEFQKPEFLEALRAARQRGVEVRVVYHYRHKDLLKDKTWLENAEAAKEHELDAVSRGRQAAPNAIMHNKFVVHLEQVEGEWQPQAVWTGSTNWTHGGVYGQLNVGHAVYDPNVAATYRRCFELLWADTDYDTLRDELRTLTPVPEEVPTGHGLWPIFSPQSDDRMLKLYGEICRGAKCLMVCAPFELATPIKDAIDDDVDGRLRFLLLDTKRSLGDSEAIRVADNLVSIATTLKSPLYDMQGKLLAARESFEHKGIHIHSKIILADPLGEDPTLVTGSANFSRNSTLNNDSNSLLLRGPSGAIDIYLTEFMRMFEHYYFRAKRDRGGNSGQRALALEEDNDWALPYYDASHPKFLDRKMFAGTL